MHRRYGVTVIELVIVMAIIGILLTIGTISFRHLQADARDKERESDVAAIQNYLESIYPREIKNSNGRVVKEAGTYPALPEDVADSEVDLEVIFGDLAGTSLTPPEVKSTRKSPSLPHGGSGNYVPIQPTSPCSSYLFCYSRPDTIKGFKDRYIYAPGPTRNELCTSSNGDNFPPTGAKTSNCRMYQLIYRTEVGDRRVVVESKRK